LFFLRHYHPKLIFLNGRSTKEEINKVLSTRVQNYGEGPIIYMEVSVVYGYNIPKCLKEFKEIIVKEIESLTAMNVVKIDVIAKKIYMPEKDKKKEK